MAQKLYTYKAIDDLISRLSEHGYECVQTREGVLGSGDWICVPPDKYRYHLIIHEVVLNEWSSAHTIRRCSKLSKANQKLLEECSCQDIVDGQ